MKTQKPVFNLISMVPMVMKITKTDIYVKLLM